MSSQLKGKKYGSMPNIGTGVTSGLSEASKFNATSQGPSEGKMTSRPMPVDTPPRKVQK